MAEEGAVAAVSPVPVDHKRKLEDLEPEAPEQVVSDPPPAEALADSNENLNSESDVNEAQNVALKPQEIVGPVSVSPEAKRPRLEEENDGSAIENGHQEQQVGHQEQQVDEPSTENVEHPEGSIPMENAEEQQSVGDFQTENHENHSTENHQEDTALPPSDENLLMNAQHPSEADLRQPATEIPQQTDFPSGQEQPTVEMQTMSRKMEVPNNKVGVLIGKAGDTIRFLQYNSGAKIQITRDADADPYSTARPVELIGTLDNINKAEKLIKDVIAEADAGGSPSLVARGFGTAQAGGATEQIQLQVPNEKVGLIIGKGGETIKNLQTRSGARIQLIPQHLPEGDQSKERTVRVTGNKKQIEMAREMIKEVMSQPVRPSPHSGVYNQQAYRPRGPAVPQQWGPRGPPPVQPTGYDYQQRGMYPSQNPQYPPPTYGGYPPQQQAPRSSFNAGWDQRPAVPVQGPPQSGGYDYYGQGGSHVGDGSVHAPVSTPAPAPTSAVGPPAQMNYNYGQPQGPEYGQPTNYPQSAPPQQNYGHGYEDQKYENQPPTQHAYGGHGVSQPGVYPQQAGTQPGYAQQPYSKPPYGMPSQGPPPQSYGPPRPNQPGEVPYQGPIQSTHSYAPNVPQQQSYPYASSGPAQQAYPYGSGPTANDGYNQPPAPTASAPGYGQPGGLVSGYGQPGGQAPTAYAQAGPSGGYGPYNSQPGYNEQPAQSNANYGFQGPSEAGYSNAAGPAYGAPPAGQVGYAQPAPNQPSYDQSMPQSGGYGGVLGNAPVGYGKSLSPQPGYGQYDSTQMYGAHH
ncbi:far upstream element-binding protein 2-like isoform X2 [Macadamia integrifolia]|uniref:far upstream element-binding protein 2-like isoform X2 n=1 Tax=Macadamia integrifolia TaxID=60698 RepID=UPI001C4E5E8B|nr:far upstream element-binding protein 2-like isoform X2 [Macadamia integrifolia]